ncbi:MAG TPA: MFS transporter, partial [Negativicutes bacterium]
AIPYVAAIGGLILFGNLADRSSKYRLYLALPLLGFAVALWLSTGIKTSILVSYVFLVLAGLFWESGLGAFWSIPPTLFPTEVIGGVRGIITCGAGFGSILGKVIFGWFVTLFGSFDAGMYGLCGMLFLAFLITLTLPKSPGKEVPQASLSQQA